LLLGAKIAPSCAFRDKKDMLNFSLAKEKRYATRKENTIY